MLSMGPLMLITIRNVNVSYSFFPGVVHIFYTNVWKLCHAPDDNVTLLSNKSTFQDGLQTFCELTI